MPADYNKGDVPPTRQTPALVDQAAPVINTWYTIANVNNAVIYGIGIAVVGVGESLQCQVTIDGVASTPATIAAVAGTDYFVHVNASAMNQALVSISEVIGGPATNKSIVAEGKNIIVGVRKTTANGAGNLRGIVDYATYP